MTNKTYIKILFLITLVLMLLSCDRIELSNRYVDTISKYIEFQLKTDSYNRTASSVQDFYIKLPYVSNMNVVNNHLLFTYKNNTNPNRIGMIQDQLPYYMENLTYVMTIDMYKPMFRYKIKCSDILLYKNDTLINNTQLSLDQVKTISDYIIRFTIKDLELSY